MALSHLHSAKTPHEVDVHDLAHAEVHKVAADPPLLAVVAMLGMENLACGVLARQDEEGQELAGEVSTGCGCHSMCHK